MNTRHLQYISDEQGHPISVIVPIEQWKAILIQYERMQSLQQRPSVLSRLKTRVDRIPTFQVRHWFYLQINTTWEDINPNFYLWLCTSLAELFDELETIEENTDLEIPTRHNRTNLMEYE